MNAYVTKKQHNTTKKQLQSSSIFKYFDYVADTVILIVERFTTTID